MAKTTTTASDVFLNKLYDFFANVGASVCGNNQATPSQVKIHTKSCLKSFVSQEITEEEVSDCFNKIKIRSSHGIDQIPAKFVKLAKCVLLPILTKLFNNCVN